MHPKLEPEIRRLLDIMPDEYKIPLLNLFNRYPSTEMVFTYDELKWKNPSFPYAKFESWLGENSVENAFKYSNRDKWFFVYSGIISESPWDFTKPMPKAKEDRYFVMEALFNNSVVPTGDYDCFLKLWDNVHEGDDIAVLKWKRDSFATYYDVLTESCELIGRIMVDNYDSKATKFNKCLKQTSAAVDFFVNPSERRKGTKYPLMNIRFDYMDKKKAT